MWFGSKSIFCFDRPLAKARPADEYLYEERIFILHSEDEDVVFDRIEAEVDSYCERQKCYFAGDLKYFKMYDDPIEFGEVYSIMRTSELDPAAYLLHFYGEPRFRPNGVFRPGQWFGVKMVFKFAGDGILPDEVLYEERVVLVQSALWEEALEIARVEAEFYAREEDCEFTGYLDLCPIRTEDPRDMDVVFMASRNSTLEPEDYIAQYIETGEERTTQVGEDPEEE